MDYHKILDVDKNASKEQIKKAYEKQVDKIKKEVVNEKRLKQFLKVFDEAYETLMNLEENIQVNKTKTLIMDEREIQRQIEYSEKNEEVCSKNRSKKKVKNIKIKIKNSREKDNKEEKSIKEEKPIREEKSKKEFELMLLPMKIILLPIIAILSIIIFIVQIINVVSWIASKILIIASIAVGAIHLYQVYLGQAINYNILILAGGILVASFFLPYILKIILKIFGTLNNKLKDFVF